MGRKVDADELVGATEIAERIGLSHPEAVHTWRKRYPDFPQPVAKLRRVMIWYWPDVERWARRTGRLHS
jgi:predicted DNA-binding transcriptional regulator AlpA